MLAKQPDRQEKPSHHSGQEIKEVAAVRSLTTKKD